MRMFSFQTFVETITYTPFAMCSFYFGMSILEMKPLNEAMAEVKSKFLPTYKVCPIFFLYLYVSIWPLEAYYHHNVTLSNLFYFTGGCICLACYCHDKLLPNPGSEQGAIYQYVQPSLDLFLGLHEAFGTRKS